MHVAAQVSHYVPAHLGRRLDWLTCFGVLAVSLGLVFYALESRSGHFVLAFAALHRWWGSVPTWRLGQ